MVRANNFRIKYLLNMCVPGRIQLQPQRPSHRQRRFDDIQSLCELHFLKQDWPRAFASSRSLGQVRSSYVIKVSSTERIKINYGNWNY